MKAKTQHDIDIADILAALFAAILNILTWPFRVLNALAFPPEPADDLDAGTQRLLAATAELEREERLASRRERRPEPRERTLASLAREYLTEGRHAPNIRHLPVDQQCVLVALRSEAYRPDEWIDDEELERQIRREWDVDGHPPIVGFEALAQTDRVFGEMLRKDLLSKRPKADVALGGVFFEAQSIRPVRRY